MFIQKISVLIKPLTRRWVAWWKKQSPYRQDRVALLAPMGAVAVFLLTIISSVGYLRYEEMERDQESVQRDLEYANQKMRLHLLDQQEQMMNLASDVSNEKLTVSEFSEQSTDLIKRHPEITGITWVDEYRRIRARAASSSADLLHIGRQGAWLDHPETEDTYLLAKELHQAIFSPPIITKPSEKMGQAESQVQLHIPINSNNHFKGVVMVEYSIDGFIQCGVFSRSFTAGFSI